MNSVGQIGGEKTVMVESRAHRNAPVNRAGRAVQQRSLMVHPHGHRASGLACIVQPVILISCSGSRAGEGGTHTCQSEPTGRSCMLALSTPPGHITGTCSGRSVLPAGALSMHYSSANKLHKT